MNYQLLTITDLYDFLKEHRFCINYEIVLKENVLLLLCNKDKISIFRFGIKKIRVELMEDSVYLEMSNFKIFLYEDRMNTEYMSHGFSLKVYRNFGIENNIREPLNE